MRKQCSSILSWERHVRFLLKSEWHIFRARGPKQSIEVVFFLSFQVSSDFRHPNVCFQAQKRLLFFSICPFQEFLNSYCLNKSNEESGTFFYFWYCLTWPFIATHFPGLQYGLWPLSRNHSVYWLLSVPCCWSAVRTLGREQEGSPRHAGRGMMQDLISITRTGLASPHRCKKHSRYSKISDVDCSRSTSFIFGILPCDFLILQGKMLMLLYILWDCKMPAFHKLATVSFLFFLLLYFHSIQVHKGVRGVVRDKSGKPIAFLTVRTRVERVIRLRERGWCYIAKYNTMNKGCRKILKYSSVEKRKSLMTCVHHQAT